jgi:hypothetical protein
MVELAFAKSDLQLFVIHSHRQRNHCAVISNGLCLQRDRRSTSEDLGGEEETGVDIVHLQARMLFQDLFNRDTVGEEPFLYLHNLCRFEVFNAL